MDKKREEIFARSRSLLERYDVIEADEENKNVFRLLRTQVNDIEMIYYYCVEVGKGNIPELDSVHKIIGEYVESLIHLRAMMCVLFGVKDMPKYMDDPESYDIKGAMCSYIKGLCKAFRTQWRDRDATDHE